MRSDLAHVGDAAAEAGSWWLLAAAAAVVFLVVQHHVVAGFDPAIVRNRIRAGLGVLAAASLLVVAVPGSQAQPTGAELPDLISDPPRPSFFNEITTPDGSTRLVVTFDGYVHNVGAGALDVVGNPQVPGGMRQRVLTNGEWQDAGAPTVRYETDDGHNHFHLIEAIDYVLWDEQAGSQTMVGSKIGFCLVDSEQMEAGVDQAYSEELDNFCEENNPGATDLRMGISPGWRDVYDATTTLQWVDVSTVVPGHYWIGAITDPNDDIVESDETNNALVLSQSSISVPGFAPRSQPPVVVDEAVVEFTLDTAVYGTVTRPIFTIVEGPRSGRLGVPVGVALESPTVRYFPGPDASGTDQIVFSVRDASSPFPLEQPTGIVQFDLGPDPGVGGPNELQDVPVVTLSPPSTFFETDFGVPFRTQIRASADGSPARVFASGLPSGLVLDETTGTISGIPTRPGIFDVELVAVGPRGGGSVEQVVQWIVNPGVASQGLDAVAGQSSARGELTRLTVGVPLLGATYQAQGLPPGVEMAPTSPQISGVPTTAGTFDVTVQQLEQGQVVGETEFSWEIRPSTAVEFVL